MLDELNRAQREFVANITHELRAPLNTMLGVANLLSLDPELSESRQRGRSGCCWVGGVTCKAW